MKKYILKVLALLTIVLLSIPAYASDNPVSPFSIFGNDDRVSVTSSSGKNLSIAKLKITFNDGSVEYGTGFLLSDTKVATAGHCLKKKTSSGTTKTASKIELYFGCSGTNASHSHTYYRSVACNSTNTISSTNWNGDSLAKSDYDYGIIILSTAVSTGNYFSLSTGGSTGNSISILGYEQTKIGEVFSNWQLLKGTGSVLDSTTYKWQYRVDVLPGQSGSPVLNSQNQVIGIHGYGANSGSEIAEPSTEYNQAVRITSTVKSFYDSY